MKGIKDINGHLVLMRPGLALKGIKYFPRRDFQNNWRLHLQIKVRSFLSTLPIFFFCD